MSWCKCCPKKCRHFISTRSSQALDTTRFISLFWSELFSGRTGLLCCNMCSFKLCNFNSTFRTSTTTGIIVQIHVHLGKRPESNPALSYMAVPYNSGQRESSLWLPLHPLQLLDQLLVTQSSQRLVRVDALLLSLLDDPSRDLCRDFSNSF